MSKDVAYVSVVYDPSANRNSTRQKLDMDLVGLMHKYGYNMGDSGWTEKRGFRERVMLFWKKKRGKKPAQKDSAGASNGASG